MDEEWCEVLMKMVGQWRERDDGITLLPFLSILSFSCTFVSPSFLSLISFISHNGYFKVLY